jgi:hypothetical protein
MTRKPGSFIGAVPLSFIKGVDMPVGSNRADIGASALMGRTIKHIVLHGCG